MCCCGKPTINGEHGYSWDGKSFGMYPPAPPTLADGDVLIFDEPGRCGGSDSHSHHFCVVLRRSGLTLLVRHGGGDESHRLRDRNGSVLASLKSLDSNGRYWLLHTIHYATKDAEDATSEKVSGTWRRAAAEKRIKTRKERGGNRVKVWIA